MGMVGIVGVSVPPSMQNVTGKYTHTFEEIQDRPVAVIGAGTLGRRIALMMASRGGTVRIYARRPRAAAEARQYVLENLPKLLEDRGFGEMGAAVGAATLSEALDGAWLAVESVPERLGHQDSALGRDRPSRAAGHHLRHQLVVISRLMVENAPRQNTVVQHALSYAAGVQRVGTDVRRPDRPRLLDTLLAVLPNSACIRLKPSKSAPGSSSTGWAIKRECVAVVAEGVARPEDADGIWKVNFGFPLGPFQMMDLVGLDVVPDDENNYAQEFPHLPQGVLDLLQSCMWTRASSVSRRARFLQLPVGEGYRRETR